MDRMLEMSGRERQDYDRWKKQQDEADRMRIARSQTDGHWKRDWDTEKYKLPISCRLNSMLKLFCKDLASAVEARQYETERTHSSRSHVQF